MKRKELQDQLLDLDNKIVKKYFDDQQKMPRKDIEFMISWLRMDMEVAMIEAPTLYDRQIELENMISEYPKELQRIVNIDYVEEAAEIRKDFAGAIQKYDIDKLEDVLSTGFTQRDLEKLAQLHRNGVYRKQIERLLRNVEYYEELSQFRHGEYIEYLLN